MAGGQSQERIVWIATSVAVVAILAVAWFIVRGQNVQAPAETAAVDEPAAPVEARTQTPVSVPAVSVPAVKPAPATGMAGIFQPPPRPVLNTQNQPRRAPMPQPTAARSAPYPVPAPPPPVLPGGHPQLELGRLAGTLRVAIPDMRNGENLPWDYTCYRTNMSPPLQWSGVPAGAHSVAVVLERRQKNKPPAWTWILFNVAPSAGHIPANLPKIAQLQGGARQGRNLYGKAQYSGPCEPHGQVPYALRLFALDSALDVPAGAERDDVVNAMNGHIIDAAEYDFVHMFRP